MKYCASCGRELQDGAKFCDGCGKQVVDEVVERCPQCGEPLPQYTPICPQCGYERKGEKATESVRHFIKTIELYDERIPPRSTKSSYQTWSKKVQSFWLFLNVILLGLPLGVYFIVEAIRYYVTPSLSRDEQRKTRFIESYIFANETRTMCGAMEYIDERMAFLTCGDVTMVTDYWSDVWKVKADQLFEKSNSMRFHHPIIHDNYSDLSANYRRVKKKLMRKTSKKILAGVLILCLSVGAILGIVFGGKAAHEKIVASKSAELVLSSEELLGKQYEFVIAEFEKLGFNNIQTNILNASGKDVVNGQVAAISILGNSDFEAGEVYKKDSKIVIDYYIFPIKIAFSSGSLQGKHYEDVTTLLRDQGFTDISTKPNYDIVFGIKYDVGEVENVSINGRTSFIEGEEFMPNVPIVITYHEKASKK